MKKLMLASGSPRRREMLKMLGIPFEVAVSDVDESLDASLDLSDAVKDVALRKARAVLEVCGDGAEVLSADTVVVVDGEVMGKPVDEADARAMLKRLSGRGHKVVTGVAFVSRDFTKTIAVETEVFVRALTEGEISWYLSTGESMDKAGAYGIQGAFAVFVHGVKGSWSNVVGLPLMETVDILAARGFAPWGDGK